MKKNVKRTLAIMLALLLTCSAFADYYVSAQADDPKESITGGENPAQNTAEDETGGQTEWYAYSGDPIMPLANENDQQENNAEITITISGKDFDSVETIHQGDRIEIDINWILRNDQTGVGGTEICVVELNPAKNVTIPDMERTGLMDSKGNVIGYVEVTDNVITMVIEHPEFLVNEKNRGVHGTITGWIDVGDQSFKDGAPVDVDLGGSFHRTFKWNGEAPDSYLNVDKKLGSLSFDKNANKWVVTYTVTISSQQGECTIDQILDKHGDSLGKIYSITAESNKSDTDLQTTELAELADLEGLTLKDGETITLTYKMDVVGDKYSVFTASDERLKNTISGEYTNNKEDSDGTFSSSVNVNVNKPRVEKRLNAEDSSDDQQVWEIVIYLNDLAQLEEELGKIIKKIEEQWGDELEPIGKSTLTATDFEPQGNGSYKVTFVTTLKDKKPESEDVTNTVEIETVYGETLKDSASYTTEGVNGPPSISKTVDEGAYDRETGRISWTVVLSGIPSTATDVTVIDLAGDGWGNSYSSVKTWGYQKLIANLQVGDKIVIENNAITDEGKGIIKTAYSIGEIVFEDEFIRQHAGEDIVLTFWTEVTDKNASMKNVLFYNNATLRYTTSKGSTKTLTDDAVYENPSALGEVLSKSGVADDKNATITYTLRVDLDSFDFTEGGNITITDTLPEGLVYVDKSADIADRFGTTYLRDVKDAYYYPSGNGPENGIFWRYHYSEDSYINENSKLIAEEYAAKGTIQYNSDSRELTFTIPVDEGFVIKQLCEQKFGWGQYNLAITFDAKVADFENYIKSETAQSYVNEAEGKYNNVDMNSTSVTTTLQPDRANLVTKNAEDHFVFKNGVHTLDFTIDVNPNAYNLTSADKLTAVDKLGTDLSYDLTSIRVFNMGTDPKSELTNGEDYTFEYSPIDNSLTFTLPDAMHLQITYTTTTTNAKRQGDVVEVKNNFQLKDIRKDGMNANVSKSVMAMQSEWRAYADRGTITLRKYWSDNGEMKAVVDSVFEICEAEVVNGELVPNWNKPALEDKYISITEENVDESGNYSELKIGVLKYNQPYALREVSGGISWAGEVKMGSNPEIYFFVIAESDAHLNQMNLPEGCKAFTVAGVENYPNYPTDEEMGTIKVGKTWEETGANKLSWDDIRDSLTFTITGKIPNKNDYEFTLTGKDLIEIGDNKYESKSYSVPFGTYTVTETCTDTDDDNFEHTGTTYTITVGDETSNSQSGRTTQSIVINENTNGTVTVSYSNTYKYTGTFPVKISKRDITEKTEIGGAELIVFKGDNEKEVVAQWTSKEGESHEIELLPGEYTLREIIAPKGYGIATDIKFKVSESGEVSLIDTTPTDQLDDITIIMYDATRENPDVEVDKVALTDGSPEVAGATLVLYSYNDQDGTWEYIDDKVSDLNGPWHLGEYLQFGETYKLVEKNAPEGYGYSEAIKFTVDENGNIKDVEYADGGNGTVLRDATEKGTANNKILMQDKVISVSLSKVDDTLQKNLVAGAEISVYQADRNGEPKAGTTWKHSWSTSSDSGAVSFGSELQADPEAEVDYVIMETQTPEGYKTADPIHIRVKPDGTVVRVVNGTEQSISAPIEMVDEEVAYLVIEKTITGELTLDEINGDLEFLVEGDNGYKQTFHIISLDNNIPSFKALGDGKYRLELEVKPSKYKVTETVKDSDGVKCSISYTLTTKDGTGTKIEAQNGEKNLATGDITLERGESATVAYENDYRYRTGKIRLLKSFSSNLPWSTIAPTLTFSIYEGEVKTENIVYEISGNDLEWKRVTDQQYECVLNNVKIGTSYIVVEKCDSIVGYDVTTTYRVSAVEDESLGDTVSNVQVTENATTEVEFINTYVTAYPVFISKIEINVSGELRGATLTVCDENEEIVEQWKSGNEPHKLELKPGIYTLTETTAPQGYNKTEEINFRVDENGDVFIIDADGTETKAGTGNKIIMEDARLDIQVSKVDITGAEEVDGAELAVYHRDDVDDEGNPKGDAAPVVSWTSEKGQPKDIGGDLELGKTYVLIETGAPKGYAYSESITFTVEEDGSITTVAETVGTIHPGTTGPTPQNRILMKDERLSIKLNKVDLNNGEELAGAVIGIYRADEVDANGRLKNLETEPLEDWESVIGECHEFGEKLYAGEDYVFVETSAPDGYQFATSIFFTITKSGEVTNVRTYTNEVVKTTTDHGDTVYLMEDEALGAEQAHATLVLTKSVKGEGIDPEDVIKTNLRFLVESDDADPAYRQVFSVSGAGFKWDEEKKMYVRNIYNLVPGTYKVTELWDESNSSGIVCKEQSWEVVLYGNGIGLTPGKGVKTDAFKLEDGYKAELEYTNTYEKGGVLVITKTIDGPITQEELEGTLQFIVTNNDTKESKTYTLEKDFTYSSATGKWTKELSLTAGGYTVEESVEVPDGRICVTKYTLDGGDAQTNTKVENVELVKGGTVTVEYTNTYSNEEGILPRPQDTVETTPNTPHNPSGGENQGDKGNGGSNSNNSGSSNSGSSNSGSNNSSAVLSETAQTATTGLTRTGDSAPIGAWLLLLVCGIAGAVGGGYALSRRKKK